MKLNINSTGAKPVFYHGEAIGKDILKAGTYMFVYDGTNYELIGDPNTDEFQGSNDTVTGRISVSGKTLFWIGRFALEFNE